VEELDPSDADVAPAGARGEEMLAAIRAGWQGVDEKPKLRPRGDGKCGGLPSPWAHVVRTASEGSKSDTEAWRDEDNELKKAPAALLDLMDEI
jgi:hypothetical protein